MDWDFRFPPDTDYLEVVVRGNISPEGLDAMAVERQRMLDSRDCRKIFFDFRAAPNPLSVIDTYHRPEALFRAGIRNQNSSAAVVSPRDLGSYRFMETVYRNRGYDLNVFTSEEEAKAFLATCGIGLLR
jgi:hypothetical protein